MDSGDCEEKQGVKGKMRSGVVEEDLYDEMEDEDDDVGLVGEDEKRKKVVAVGRKGSNSTGCGVPPPHCQVERCVADLSEAKRYHRRHKVCEIHAKATVVIVSGIRQRFCQQCSRFQELTEFDDTKRSCRVRLAGHNERRRKMATELCGAGSSRKVVVGEYRQVDDRGRVQLTLPGGNSAYKHFQIR